MKKQNLKELAKIKYKNTEAFSRHAFPQTRRDFVKLGLLSGGGLLVPSFFPKNLWAQQKIQLPFLTFDLAGGASLPGNFLVGKKGGAEDLARQYEQNGWDPRKASSLDKTFGLPMSSLESGLLRGLKETLPQPLLAANQRYFKMASHLHFSLDDTGVNKTSALTTISKIGLQGSDLKNGLGHQASLSGGNASSFLEDSKFKPRIVTSVEDVLKITSLGDGFDQLPANTKTQLIAALAQSSDSSTKNAYEQLAKFGNRHEKGNPQNDSIMNQIYSMNDNNDLIQAAIVLNVLKGYTGPGVITIDGCDYHDGGRETGDQKDVEIGRAIGRAVHAAFLNKKPLFFQIITDGGMTSDSFNRRWQGDSPLRSMTILGYFNPHKPVLLRKNQIGYVTDSGEVDISNPISASADKGAISSIVNYLYVHNEIGSVEKVLGRMSAQEIDELLVFA
jgi:hypothetical protein